LSTESGQTGRTRRRPARARSDGRRLCRCDGRIQLPLPRGELDADPSGLGRARTSALAFMVLVPSRTSSIGITRAADVVLPSLRVCGGSGRMVDDNRRPEHPICNNTNEQKNGDDDRRNEVFHGLSLTGEPDRRLQSAHYFQTLPGALGGGEPERNGRRAALQYAGEYCRR
jgi:hypothetical protein